MIFSIALNSKVFCHFFAKNSLPKNQFYVPSTYPHLVRFHNSTDPWEHKMCVMVLFMVEWYLFLKLREKVLKLDAEGQEFA